MKRTAIDPRPARTDLTSREAAKFLGGIITSLLDMADEKDVRTAIRWWAELTDEQWNQTVSLCQRLQEAIKRG
jgi:hypothetical protein